MGTAGNGKNSAIGNKNGPATSPCVKGEGQTDDPDSSLVKGQMAGSRQILLLFSRREEDDGAPGHCLPGAAITWSGWPKCWPRTRQGYGKQRSDGCERGSDGLMVGRDRF